MRDERTIETHTQQGWGMVRTSMYRLTGEFVAESCGGKLLQGQAVAAYGGVSIDSRTLVAGQAFVAIRGPRHDGHDYLAQAVERGAVGLVIRWSRAEAALEATATLQDRVFVVAVPDTEKALRDMATAWVEVMAPVVVGITGSVGKSTTKDLCAAVASSRYATHATSGNLNNLYGVSLTCLGLVPAHEVLVVEMGTSAPGEIAALCRIARPRIGVVTAVAPAHIEGLKSLDGVAIAKSEMVEAVPEDGVAVLNADDPRVRAMRSRTMARCLMYGSDEGCDVRLTGVDIEGDGRTRCRMVVAGKSVETVLSLLGTHQAYNAAAAMAVGLALGVEPEEAALAMSAVQPGKHRMSLKNAGSVRCLDDCYNASPRSMTAALETLRRLPADGGRRMAVLGDMLELGDLTEEAHRRVGAEAVRCGVEYLVAVGRHARLFREGAVGAGLPGNAVVETPDALAALDVVAAIIRPGDLVLVKGSRGVGLEVVVDWILSTFGKSRDMGD